MAPTLEPEKPKTYQDIDNQVLPALKANAGANNPPEYAPGEEFNEEEAKNGEPITADKRSAADPLIDVFGEPVIRMLFSRTWALREKGIDQIEDEILNQNRHEESQAFVAGVGVVKNTITDKIIGVCTRSIQFFASLCQRVDPSLNGQ